MNGPAPGAPSYGCAKSSFECGKIWKKLTTVLAYTGCTIGSVTFLRNDTKYYEGAVAKNFSSHWVDRCRIYAYKISSPHQFLISHKLLFCYGANLGT